MIFSIWKKTIDVISSKVFVALLFYSAISLNIYAEGRNESRYCVDNSTFDFGTVNDKQGPLSCFFSIMNVGEIPFSILNVYASCSCTKVTWTKAEIKPGQCGTINVSYSNDEGPHHFDKMLRAKISDSDTPLILHIKGNVIKWHETSNDKYSDNKCPLQFSSRYIDIGPTYPFKNYSGAFSMANTINDSIYIAVTLPNNRIHVNTTQFVISPKTKKDLKYTFSIKDEEYGQHIDTVQIGWKKEHKEEWTTISLLFHYILNSSPSRNISPPILSLAEDHISLGKVRSSQKIVKNIIASNTGLSSLNIYRVEVHNKEILFQPLIVEPGAKAEIPIEFSFENSDRGKCIHTVDIYTDSIDRPVRHIYVTYFVRFSFTYLIAQIKTYFQKLHEKSADAHLTPNTD